MGSVPLFLLRHRITVEPYLGEWGKYGPPVTDIRCFINRQVRTSGTARFSSAKIATRPGENIPEGSRVTLPEGDRGYVEAAALHDMPGMPTPDHIEIAITIGVVDYGPALGGELVIILRRAATGAQDRYHNDIYATTEVPVYAAVRAAGSTETDSGSRDKVRDTIEVTVPPGTEVASSDRLRVRGLVYVIDGTPEPGNDPATGVASGIRITARRVTG